MSRCYKIVEIESNLYAFTNSEVLGEFLKREHSTPICPYTSKIKNPKEEKVIQDFSYCVFLMS